MLNMLAKSLLVSTSLSPALIAVAVNQYELGEPWTSWVCWLAVALILLVLCWALLKYAAKNAQKRTFYIKEFERKDQEMVTFLFIYLLPFIRSDSSTFANEWLTTVYILAIIILAIAYTGAFHFNPAMRLFLGYRFYAVKDRHGVSNLLISRTDLRRSDEKVQTVKLAGNVYLHIGNRNA